MELYCKDAAERHGCVLVTQDLALAWMLSCISEIAYAANVQRASAMAASVLEHLDNVPVPGSGPPLLGVASEEMRTIVDGWIALSPKSRALLLQTWRGDKLYRAHAELAECIWIGGGEGPDLLAFGPMRGGRDSWPSRLSAANLEDLATGGAFAKVMAAGRERWATEAWNQAGGASWDHVAALALKSMTDLCECVPAWTSVDPSHLRRRAKDHRVAVDMNVALYATWLDCLESLRPCVKKLDAAGFRSAARRARGHLEDCIQLLGIVLRAARNQGMVGAEEDRLEVFRVLAVGSAWRCKRLHPAENADPVIRRVDSRIGDTLCQGYRWGLPAGNEDAGRGTAGK